MSEPFEDESAEREWARARFAEYLLGRLDDDDTERLTMAVAVYSGLMDDLEDAETELIEAYLDQRLGSDESARFERHYLQTGDLENRARFKIRQALRSPQVLREAQALRPVPPARSRLTLVSSVAAAALLAAAVFGGLYYVKSRELSRVLALLNQRQTPPRPEENPQEQPAGSLSPEGLLLSARIVGTGTVPVDEPPRRLIWTPVPDYRAQYRFRIYPAGGDEITSPPLSPKNNAVEYAIPNPPALPWDVFVLGAARDRALAHYLVRKR